MTKFMTQEEFDALPKETTESKKRTFTFMTQEEFDALPKAPKEYPTFMTENEYENYVK